MRMKKVIGILVLLSILISPISSFSGVKPVTAAVDNSKHLPQDVQSIPVADPQSVVAIQGYYNPITLTGSDADGDELTFDVVQGPSHGTLTGNAPYLTYRSNGDYVGQDSFWFVVSDGTSDSEQAEVSITVRTNANPVADPQSVVAIQGYYNPITLTGSDTDGDELTFIVVQGPSHGTLTGNAPFLTYQSDAGYVGPDVFWFVATDGIGESPATAVRITVRTNGDPVADPQSVVAIQGVDTPITLSGSDPDLDPLTFIVVQEPSHGTLTGDAPNLTYRSNGDYIGPDVFWFVATDGIGESPATPVNITVNEDMNTIPVADPQSVVAIQGYYNPITLTGSDADGDELTFDVVQGPSHGTLTGNAPYLTYRSNGDYVGQDSFWFVVSDGTSDSEQAEVSITVRTNANPVADPQSVVAIQGYYNPITLTGSDTDGDELTFIVVQGPSHGTLTGNAPFLTYQSDAGYVGPDVFWFVATDGIGESPATAVRITVRTNGDPVADPQSVVAIQGVDTPITLSGSDPDLDPLTFIVVQEPSHGTLTGDAPNLTYRSNGDYIGPDVFWFVATDGIGESPATKVSINVIPSGPTTVFFDDFETNLGWVRNPSGKDNATSGKWERANPESTWYWGIKQQGSTVSGSYDLVTGPLAGWEPGKYDVDGGITTIKSPQITLPENGELTLSFSYYFAHAVNSSSSDFLRVKVVGQNTITVLSEFGARNNDDANWSSFSTSLNNLAGQSVYILIEVADYGTASLVEAAIDDVQIVATGAANN